MNIFGAFKRAKWLQDHKQNIRVNETKAHLFFASMLTTQYSPTYFQELYISIHPTEGIIQRGPFSKVNMSDIKRLFWCEMKLNFNAVPSSTCFCSLLQVKLIKDQWKLICTLCASRGWWELQQMSCIFINNNMITSKSSKHLLMFKAVCHHNTNKPHKYMQLILSIGIGSCITIVTHRPLEVVYVLQHL